MIKAHKSLIKVFLLKLKNNSIIGTPQNEQIASYWPRRTPEMGKINLKGSVHDADKLCRALTKPYPGAFYIYKNNKIPVWKIKKSPKKNTSNIEPGKVITNNNDDVMVKCYDCFLWIIEHDFKEIPKSGEYLL